MAPFNKRQIGYIQAIAGRQQHRTLICGADHRQLSSDTAPTAELYKPQTLYGSKVDGLGYTGSDADAKSLLLYSWLLDEIERGFDSRTVHNDDKLTQEDFNDLVEVGNGMGDYTKLRVFDAAVKGTAHVDTGGHITQDGDGIPNVYANSDVVVNPESIPSTVRATPDGYLNSTTVKFRFTLPRDMGEVVSSNQMPMGQDHYEFRWIVWRSKRPTVSWQATGTASEAGTEAEQDKTNYYSTNLEMIRDGASFRNPGYDFFMSQTGRKRGLLGYTLNKDLDKDKFWNLSSTDQAKIAQASEAYSGQAYNSSASNYSNASSHVKFTLDKPVQETGFTVDDLMTQMINKDDYVVMKDVRFFLGKEHGKSHFEETLHWDWNDPIDTPYDNVLSSSTLNSKNYRWHMTIIGTSGGRSPCKLNCQVRWTTKMESG